MNTEKTIFWQRFYDLCRKEGKRPNPVGKEIGLSSGIISKWKRDNRLPNSETLLKLAAYFNCSTDYLLGISDKITPDAPVNIAMIPGWTIATAKDAPLQIYISKDAIAVQKNPNSNNKQNTNITCLKFTDTDTAEKELGVDMDFNIIINRPVSKEEIDTIKNQLKNQLKKNEQNSFEIVHQIIAEMFTADEIVKTTQEEHINIDTLYP